MGDHPCKRFKRSCSQCNTMSVVMAQSNLLKLVLSNLSAKQLLSAPFIVSKFWNELCVDLLRRRQGFSLVLDSKAEKDGDAHLPVIEDFLNTSCYLPKKVVILTSKKLLASAEYIRDKSHKLCYSEVFKMARHQMMSYFTKREMLPSVCELYALSSFGVYGYLGHREVLVLNTATEVNDTKFGAVALTFSESYSQNIRLYSLPDSLVDEQLTESLLKSHIGCPNSFQIKFMLYLSAQHGEFPRTLLGNLVDLLPNIAVTGALIDQHSSYDQDCNSKITPDCISGLAVFGDNVSCSCLVLDESCSEEEEIKSRIEMFRKSVGSLSKHCFAVLVFCLARNTSNDIKYFKAYFEDVQAIGLYGYGEFGRNVVRGVCSNPSENYDHAYSTVISIVDFDSPRGY